jgi:hypothetical protein
MAKVKIPKRVGGVKIPKKVRKKAKKALKAVESPVVRQLAAAAVGAAAQARADRTARDDGDGANGARAHATVRIGGAKIGDALRSAAIDGLRRFLEGFEEGLRDDSSNGERSARPSRKSNSPPAPNAE